MTATDFYKSLADDIRLKSILLILQEGELCVCELMVALDEQSQPKISRHLALLKSSGLLLTRKHKQWVFYTLNPNIATWMRQVIIATLKDNADFIAPSMKALHRMGDRPTRSNICCN